jgi:hypothetical protein
MLLSYEIYNVLWVWKNLLSKSKHKKNLQNNSSLESKLTYQQGYKKLTNGFFQLNP